MCKTHPLQIAVTVYTGQTNAGTLNNKLEDTLVPHIAAHVADIAHISVHIVDIALDIADNSVHMADIAVTHS